MGVTSNILRKVFFVAGILNFKMADSHFFQWFLIETIEKNVTRANFVPRTTMIKNNLNSKIVATFLAKYITAYTTLYISSISEFD